MIKDSDHWWVHEPLVKDNDKGSGQMIKGLMLMTTINQWFDFSSANYAQWMAGAISKWMKIEMWIITNLNRPIISLNTHEHW